MEKWRKRDIGGREREGRGKVFQSPNISILVLGKVQHEKFFQASHNLLGFVHNGSKAV